MRDREREEKKTGWGGEAFGSRVGKGVAKPEGQVILFLSNDAKKEARKKDDEKKKKEHD